jgi:hypothetical protein
MKIKLQKNLKPAFNRLNNKKTVQRRIMESNKEKLKRQHQWKRKIKRMNHQEHNPNPEVHQMKKF